MSEAVQIPETPHDEPVTARQLPDPTGWKILIALPEVEETYGGVIAKAKQTMQTEEIGTVVGFVLKMGPLCYRDERKFGPNPQPWCKVGDFITMRSYSGTRLKIHGKEFRLINDDSVEAVVEDPRGIEKA